LYYAQLYSLADQDRDGKISGGEGAIFLRKSGLNDQQLHLIWDMADAKKQGYLLQRDFAIAMRLISMGQQGQSPSIAQIQNVTKLPQFVDIPLPNISPPFPTSITEQEKYKYDNLFLQADLNRDGFVDGAEAKTYFTKANVPSEKLALIWNLSELDKDGKLSKVEFRIAMHMIYWILKGEQLPSSIPESLFQSAQEGLENEKRGRSTSAPPSTMMPNNNIVPQYVQQQYIGQQVPTLPIQQSFVQSQNEQPNQYFGSQQTFTPQSSQVTYIQQQTYPNQPPMQSIPQQIKAPSPRDPFGSFPSSSGDLMFTPAPSKNNYDQNKLVAQHTLPGASFEQRVNFNNELSSAINRKKVQ